MPQKLLITEPYKIDFFTSDRAPIKPNEILIKNTTSGN